MICPRITQISRKKISVIREISGQKKTLINLFTEIKNSLHKFYFY